MATSQVILDQPIEITTRERTSEGFLRCEGAITKVGVASYQGKELGKTGEDADKAFRIYRPESVVFADQTKDSAKLKPMTLGHPPNKELDAQTARLYSVGHAGENVRKLDDKRLGTNFLITDAKAIQDLEDGRSQLSAGQTIAMVAEKGVFEDQPYDYVATGFIDFNHHAMVPKGRIGDDVKIFDENGGDKVMDEDRIRAVIADTIKANLPDIKQGDEPDPVAPTDDDAPKKAEGSKFESRFTEALIGAFKVMLADSMKNEKQTLKESLTAEIKAEIEQGVAKNEPAAKTVDPETKVLTDEDVRSMASARARLLLDTIPLIPKDTSVDDKSDKEILEVALRDSVDGAAEKSEDYLLGVLSQVVRSRKASKESADKQAPAPTQTTINDVDKKSDMEAAYAEANKLRQNAWIEAKA